MSTSQPTKTWLNRLSRWTWLAIKILWKVTTIVIYVTLSIAFGILQVMGAFILGMMSANSLKNHRRLHRERGDFRLG